MDNDQLKYILIKFQPWWDEIPAIIIADVCGRTYIANHTWGSINFEQLMQLDNAEKLISLESLELEFMKPAMNRFIELVKQVANSIIAKWYLEYDDKYKSAKDNVALYKAFIADTSLDDVYTCIGFTEVVIGLKRLINICEYTEIDHMMKLAQQYSTTYKVVEGV